MFVSLCASYLSSRHWPFGGDLIRPRAGHFYSHIFFAEFLADHTTLETRKSSIAYIILTRSRSLVKSTLRFHLISKAILGASTKRTTVSVLAWAGGIIIHSKFAPS